MLGWFPEAVGSKENIKEGLPMDLTTQASHFLVLPAVDGDFVICRNAPCGQVLVLPIRCLVCPAADDDCCQLVINARRKGNKSNYQSAWNKRTSWCHQQKVNPFRCSLDFVLEYPAHLHQLGYSSWAIDTQRSAISAFHSNDFSFTTRNHPLIKNFMKGIANL